MINSQDDFVKLHLHCQYGNKVTLENYLADFHWSDRRRVAHVKECYSDHKILLY